MQFISRVRNAIKARLLKYPRIIEALTQRRVYSYDFLIDAFPQRLAALIKYMADTGKGTNDCLDKGCLPVAVHFYSPIPEIADLRERNVWNQKSASIGLDYNIERQMEFLSELGRQYGRECDWPTNPSDNPIDFFVNNSSFSYGCAASLYSMIRHYKPSQIIEIGSGNSSLVINQALAKNDLESERRCQYSVIDPYPRDVIEQLPSLMKLMQQRVELTDPEFFERLGEGDILFIDSSHSVKIGSDVNYLILEVLPRLKPGVVVHFHDIPLPFEYPEVYATNPGFRVFWTEAYLLQAFLCQNDKFEIVLAMNYVMTTQLEEFKASFPVFDPVEHKFTSSSFWIRRKLA